MSVTAIRLENFMAFADTGWLELRPISLLFGRNSSGKSAIIRALRLLKQSLDQPASEDPLRFTVEYGLNQGNFENTVHSAVYVPAHSDVSDEEVSGDPQGEVITFHFRCDLAITGVIDTLLDVVNRQRIRWNELPLEISKTLTWVDLSLSYARSYDVEDKQWNVELVSLEIAAPWPSLGEHRTVYSLQRECEVASLQQWSWLPEWEPYSDFLHGHQVDPTDINWAEVGVKRTVGFFPELDVPESFYRYPSGPFLNDVTFIQTLLQALKETIENFLRSMLYLGPMRPEPKRVYAFDQAKMEAWRKQGWGAYLDFLQAESGGSQTSEEIGAWLVHLQLGDQAQATPQLLGDLGFVSNVQMYEVKNIEDNTGPLSTQKEITNIYQFKIFDADDKNKSTVIFNLKDVGFGASQVLPILVQCLVASPGSLVVIEQPELHLHPKVQARLADLFIAMSHTLEKVERDQNGSEKRIRHEHSNVPFLIKETENVEVKQSTIRFLVETHSDHLLLRLRRRVAETASGKPTTTLTPDNVIAFFVERPEGLNKSFLQIIRITHTGDFHQIPGGFQDFFTNDADALALSKARRITKLADKK